MPTTAGIESVVMPALIRRRVAIESVSTALSRPDVRGYGQPEADCEETEERNEDSEPEPPGGVPGHNRGEHRKGGVAQAPGGQREPDGRADVGRVDVRQDRKPRGPVQGRREAKGDGGDEQHPDLRREGDECESGCGDQGAQHQDVPLADPVTEDAARNVAEGVRAPQHRQEQSRHGQVDTELRLDVGDQRRIDEAYVFTPRTISPLSRKLLLTQQ